MKIKLTEIFYSIQAEGKNIGKPSIFIRFAGCPLHCEWCDSQYSWSTKKSITIDEIIKEIKQYPCKHIVITGGEPLMQRKGLHELMSVLCDEKYSIEIETNGYYPFFDSRIDFYPLTHWNGVQWNVSPKLKTAKTKKEAYEVKNLAQFVILAHGKVIFKFVITDSKKDTREILSLTNELLQWERELSAENIFLMPQGQTREEIIKNSEEVVELCKIYGFQFSPRLHILVWDKKRGV